MFLVNIPASGNYVIRANFNLSQDSTPPLVMRAHGQLMFMPYWHARLDTVLDQMETQITFFQIIKNISHLHYSFMFKIKIYNSRASLVAQWLGVCLPMRGTRVRALVWEDPTCHGATGPVSHNYWACASGACAPQQERPRQWEARALRWRVAPLAATRESPRTETKTQHSQK